ncbi:MAG: hypothetical protein M1818_001551 [Claussenomyces sp. TS43310]|nr:MAG: hypothetical protein M1818_001551 [Claussenomyces sp. TS43310]
MTDTGLNTINLGDITAWQQAILCILMVMGDLTLVSISMVMVRRYYFGKKIKALLKTSKTGRDLAKEIEEGHQHHGNLRKRRKDMEDRPRTSYGDTSADFLLPQHRGYGGFPAPWEHDFVKIAFSKVFGPSFRRIGSPLKAQDHHYLSFEPSLDSRGRFRNLTEEQEHELGGVEYRALIFLSWMLPIYTISWLTFVTVVLVPYSTRAEVASIIRSAQPGDLRPEWWAFFVTIASYTNGGLNLLNANMIPFAHDYLILIFSGIGIVAGNMFYPVFLRLFIWLISKVVPQHSQLHHSLSFLLHHPRRCYLFLFPKKNTWYLVGIQSGITLLGWMLFEILDINYQAVDPGLPVGQRIMDGLYNSNGLRASGAYTITLSSISPALQVFYMVVMYLSAFPIIMSMRQTNVYEERSLGVDSNEKTEEDREGSGGSSLLAMHVRNQLAYDLWWLILSIFLIAIIERTSLGQPAPGFSLFSVIFEVVSAYGTVGFSLGLPAADYSFCGAWHALSKLILISVMLRGRHRILPPAIDRAVLLPGERLMLRLDAESRSRTSPDADEAVRTRQQHARIREEESGAQAERRDGKQDPEGDDDVGESPGEGGPNGVLSS